MAAISPVQENLRIAWGSLGQRDVMLTLTNRWYPEGKKKIYQGFKRQEFDREFACGVSGNLDRGTCSNLIGSGGGVSQPSKMVWLGEWTQI